MILLLILGFGLVILLELPGLIQRRDCRETVVFFALLMVGFVLSVMMIMGVSMPEVSTTMNKIYKNLFQP